MEKESLHAELEQEILDLGGRIERGASHGKVRETIRESMGERIYGSPLPPERISEATPQRPSAAPPQSAGPLPRYASDAPAEVKLKAEELLELAWHKGISAAVKEARKADPLTMDIFHDAITEKLFEEFIKRGILK